MTTMLVAELAILAIGDAMHISLVSDFCRFARVALLVGYVLEMTFFIAVLSINVKCVELTDLDDRQTSKRLRELQKVSLDADTAPDFCPIQEPIDDATEPKTCAECKQFKTHRTANAIVLCLIILSLFRVSSWTTADNSIRDNDNVLNRELVSTSTRFWNAVNPLHESMLLQVNPPYLVLFTAEDASAYALELEEYYATKSSFSSSNPPVEQQHSRFRQFLFNTLKRIISIIVRINVPSILLCIVLVGILLWLKPSSREQLLQPLFAYVYLLLSEKCVALIRTALLQVPGSMGQRIAQELGDYDENGVHRGAILAQEQFNQQQLNHSIQQVNIKTLSGKHVADVRKIAVNAKHGCVVSCGQDGRIVLWDGIQAEWMARLDRVRQTQNGAIKGDLNPNYFRSNNKRRAKHITGSARCVKIDQGNKWIALGFDDGMIRVWDMDSGDLLRELQVETPMEEEEGVLQQLRHRRKPMDQPKRHLDRVIAIQFVGQVTEYCHPLVAEAAAKQAMSDDHSSQNYLVSVHKSGVIREWDIPSGECIQSVPSHHTRDITILHVVECKAPHRKLGVTWVFTASKDGIVKCWERRSIKVEEVATSSWTLAYTLDGHNGHAITALATELPVGGMGALVTGSSDGAVKQKQVAIAGGPLLKFSKMSNEPSKKHKDGANHRGPITQVVVARYCEVENGPGLCRGCDTCFGNGFFVASCSMDETVHTWRLERADGKHQGSCSLCTKDYHQKRYRSRNDDNKRQRRSSSPRRRMQDGLLDIEQLGGETNIALAPTYLGRIEQLAGRGLVFCDNMVLGGVRKKTDANDWQAWFASLKYYDPSTHQHDEIPVETFDLDEQPYVAPVRKSFWHLLFGQDEEMTPPSEPIRHESDDDDDEEFEEANEVLPFSTVRHVIPLNGSGLACDYGNFIKLVYLDDRSRKRNTQQPVAAKHSKKSSACCSGKSGAQCCGGKNKVNGKCCGGKGRVKKVRPSCNAMDCSSIADCSRASECSLSPY
ncbi:WD40-repeat-containing domain protein [Fennellomyces sp. T-0311]|nr:WD40-repeat-containing domain protein [Fennellomyces sp. T-0311]